MNGSGIHLNRYGKGKLVMNLIKKVREFGRKNFNRNWRQGGLSLTLPQYYVSDCVCNNDCKRKLDTAGRKHLLEINHASSSADFQDTGNQMNALHKVRIKNANRLPSSHLNINSLQNKFEMLVEIIKDKTDINLW